MDSKKELVQRLVESFINEEAAPVFDDQGAIAVAAPGAAEVVPVTFQNALTRTAGLILITMPKPRCVPFAAPTIVLCDLNVRDWHAYSPVKAVVDIILNHRTDITEADVKRCVLAGDIEALPAVARPPVGAMHVNHCTQIAFIPGGSVPCY